MSGDGDRIHIKGFDHGTVALLKGVANEAARAAVRETLLTLGINVNDPIAAQENFSALREFSKPENRAALAWAKKTQAFTGSIVFKAAMTFVVIGVLGAAHWTYDSVREFLVIPTNNSH